MQRRVLMIAFHFPPLAGSSGIQRTLRFVQQLPCYGWQPIVLSASALAYTHTRSDLLQEIPATTVVRRAFAVDAARHLAVAGRYPGWLARPDRWVSWRFAAVWQGMRLIKQFQPHLIWSTYPIATAHLIAATLHRRSRIPWVADFRDPMAQQGYPADPKTWQQFNSIEAEAITQAGCSVFTTPSAAALYRARYPVAAERIHVLENGYDEDSFVAAQQCSPRPLHVGTMTLLHSGIVYPRERDPTQLFQALQQLHATKILLPGKLKIRFRAAVNEALLWQLAARYGVESFIEVCPAVDYRDALREMLDADGLLVLQAANCNQQVPAKIYEYLRARRPIVCLSDPQGDTVAVLQQAGIKVSARLDQATEIAALLKSFMSGETAAFMSEETAVLRASRLGRAGMLAQHFDRLLT